MEQDGRKTKTYGDTTPFRAIVPRIRRCGLSPSNVINFPWLEHSLSQFLLKTIGLWCKARSFIEQKQHLSMFLFSDGHRKPDIA